MARAFRAGKGQSKLVALERVFSEPETRVPTLFEKRVAPRSRRASLTASLLRRSAESCRQDLVRSPPALRATSAAFWGAGPQAVAGCVESPASSPASFRFPRDRKVMTGLGSRLRQASVNSCIFAK